MEENDSRPRPRLAYVDWARGIAVLLMIEAHTVDAWTRLNVRRSIPFRDATVLGGFAAPMFLWLAGLAVVLAATRSAERTGSRATAATTICRRGVEIFILAFLFRLQAFMVSPGSHPVTLFRVDILNIMGPAIAAAGVVWFAASTTARRVTAYALLAIVVSMVTPLVRLSPFVGWLPLWVQWYVRPAAEYTTFTLFPWAGFVFAGGAVGALIAAARNPRDERSVNAILGIVGAALVATGFYTASRPSIYTSSAFWTSSPTWFAIRLGILMIALTVIYASETVLAALKRRATPDAALKGRATDDAALKGRATDDAALKGRATDDAALKGRATKDGVKEVAQGFSPAIDPLARLGRSSLFIYWIHVELVYGYASWGWRHRLPLWGTAIAYVLFCILMYRAIGWRDQAVTKWRNRPLGPRTASRSATA